MMLSKYYSDKLKDGLVDFSRKSKLERIAEQKKFTEEQKIKDQEYVQKILPFSDPLKRALHFQELNCLTQSDLNFYSCWNMRKILTDEKVAYNQLAKIKTILPRRFGHLTDKTVITISKHTNRELEYYSLNKTKDCYYHLEKIVHDRVKSMEDSSSEVEICKYNNQDIVNHTSLGDDSTIICLDGYTFSYFGFRRDHITHGKPNIYRFIQMPHNSSSVSKYTFEIKAPRAKEFRDAATSLNYVAVAFGNNLFIHNWLSNSDISYSQYYNVNKVTRKRGRSQGSSDIMALCFVKTSKEELNHLDAILYIGFRNGTLIAIPVNDNNIDFDNRVMVPLPTELKSIISLHECFDGGLIVSGLSNGIGDFQELLYIPMFNLQDFKTLKLIKLNTQYYNIVRNQEICCVTKNKKFFCYGKKGYKKDSLNVSQGGFDVYLLDSLNIKENAGKSKKKFEVFPITKMSNYITDDIPFTDSTLYSVSSIDNFDSSPGSSKEERYYKGIQYETEQIESDLSYGSRIAMLFNTPTSTHLSSETCMLVSVELV